MYFRFFGEKFPNLHTWMLKQMNLLVLAEDMLILNNAANVDEISQSFDVGKRNNSDGAYVYSIALPKGIVGNF